MSRARADPSQPTRASTFILGISRALLAEDPREALGLVQQVRPSGPRRDLDQRRAFAGQSPKYIRDVLGWKLTGQQEGVLEFIEAHPYVLIPSANNVGKTFLLGAYAVYVFDAVASLPDEEAGREEQGAQILLPGPGLQSIKRTIYANILMHMKRAEGRGFPMPGWRSEKSVLCQVHEQWFIEPVTPPREVGKEVQHAASGRHHRIQMALIEEGPGCPEVVWRSVEATCSGDGNKIISPFNPTEAAGPAFLRSKRGMYRVYPLSALDHPNILERRTVVPGAIDHRKIETRLHEECRDIGPYPATQPDPAYQDILYAFPPPAARTKRQKDWPDEMPRRDGIPGHAKGPVRVLRPGPLVVSQVLGQWSKSGTRSLFNAAKLDEAIERWRSGVDPARVPDRFGLDIGRAEDGDLSVSVPIWGPGAEEALLAFLAAEPESPALADKVRARIRIRAGMPIVHINGEGPDVANHVAHTYPDSYGNLDLGGPGYSVVDHGRRVLEMFWHGVSFGAAALVPVPGEPHCYNMRTSMYVRAARLVAVGLIDVPDDNELREELLAHNVVEKVRIAAIVDETGQEVNSKQPVVELIPKDTIKKSIGRSPDKADAFVLGCLDPQAQAGGWDIW